MHMLERKDLEAIREIVRGELVPVKEELRQEIRLEIDRLRADIMSVVEQNIMPQFEYMHEQFDFMHRQFAYMHEQFGDIRRELGDMKRNARIVWAS